MDCCDLERLLPAYADGEFAAGESSEVEAHLEECGRCRDEVAALVAFRSFLQQKCSDAPTAAPSALRARIRKDVARQHAVDQVRRFSVYSAVAVGLVAVASFGYAVGGREGPEPEEVLLDAVDKHARALPVEVASGADLPTWFRGKVDFNVRVPTFHSPSAPRLVGARLANVRDRQAAYFVYGGGEDSSRRATLLVFPGEIDDLPGRKAQVAGREVVMANERGYNVALWQQSGIVYSLVSDLNESDMLQLVSEVEAR